MVARHLAPPPEHPHQPTNFTDGPPVLAGLRSHIFDTTLHASTPDYLKDHVIAGAVLMPAAGFLELGLGAMCRIAGRSGEDPALELRDVLFSHVLAFGSAPREVRVTLEPRAPGWAFAVLSSRPEERSTQAGWMTHAAGEAHEVTAPALADIEVSALRDRMRERRTHADIYAHLAEAGLLYGPAFRALSEVWSGDGEALGRIDLPIATHDATAHYAHPALIDACFQVVAFALERALGSDPLMPLRLQRALFHQCLGHGPFWCHVTLRRRGASRLALVADLVIYSASGAERGRIERLVLAPVPRSTLARLIGDETDAEEDGARRIKTRG